jgi:hypothetical protein
MARKKKNPVDKWVQNAIGKPGALHEALKVPEGQPIPAAKLKIKPSDSPLMRKRKNLAATMKKLKHPKKGK